MYRVRWPDTAFIGRDLARPGVEPPGMKAAPRSPHSISEMSYSMVNSAALLNRPAVLTTTSRSPRTPLGTRTFN